MRVYGQRPPRAPKKLNPYTVTLPDFTKPAENYEGQIAGSWKDRKIVIPFRLVHEVATLNGYKLDIVTAVYYYMPLYARDHGKALADILRKSIHDALIAAGWGTTNPDRDIDRLFGYRAPVSFWPFFIDEEYRYHRI
jgi:hypothetical protein